MSYIVEYIPGKEFGIKQAASYAEVQELMDRVYQEDPSYWPFGLRVNAGDTDVFLVRDNLTKKACGFVGWQELQRNNKRIGSYYIGILPEYRGNGMAKEAVAKILQKKAAQVDYVRALIMPHNERSQKLAKSLHVPFVSSFEAL